MAKKKNVDQVISEYMSKLGKKGGAKSRRKLTKKQARAMSEARWGKEKKEKG
jgi:hypothetical protein